MFWSCNTNRSLHRCHLRIGKKTHAPIANDWRARNDYGLSIQENWKKKFNLIIIGLINLFACGISTLCACLSLTWRFTYTKTHLFVFSWNVLCTAAPRSVISFSIEVNCNWFSATTNNDLRNCHHWRQVNVVKVWSDPMSTGIFWFSFRVFAPSKV